MRGSGSRCVLWAAMGLVSLSCVYVAAPEEVARAESAGDAPTSGEARRLFSLGSARYTAGRFEEALDLLRASYRLLPSPNSGLLIARCLRELKKPAEALAVYTSVLSEARQRVAQDPKYEQTADAASAEAAAVRQTLGSLRIKIAHATPATRVEVDGTPVAPPSDGDLVVWRSPGDATVRVRPPDGPEQSRTVSVRVTEEAVVDFDVSPSASTRAPSPSPESPPPADVRAPAPGWMLPSALASSAVAVAGGIVFAGFGLSSDATFRDLSRRCGPSSCGPADRADAESGKRAQTIANVGLVVGVVGAVAAGVLFALVATSGSGKSAGRPARRLVPGALGSAGFRFDAY